MKLFASSLLVLSAISFVTGIAIDKRVVAKNAMAVSYTIQDTPFCLSSAVPSYLAIRSQRFIDSGYYVAIPGPINATDCALYVGIINEAGNQAIATLVDTTTDGTIKLSKASWKLAAPTGANTFPAVYFVSNAG